MCKVFGTCLNQDFPNQEIKKSRNQRYEYRLVFPKSTPNARMAFVGYGCHLAFPQIYAEYAFGIRRV